MTDPQQLNRALALAGVVQIASLVKQLAWKGTLSQQDLETSIHSIFQVIPANVIEVYGSKQNVRRGLEQLIALLSEQKGPKDPEIARYTISLLHLERLLIKKPAMLNIVQRGVERAKNQAYHFSPTHDNVIANLASVYTDSLSTFKFRIHVAGEGAHLTNNNNVNKVRVLLLAGIRSAVLWRQLGGSRWQLVFGKKTIISDAREILASINEVETA